MARPWDERWDDDLRAAWADGMPVERIAVHTGCAIGAVSDRAHRLGFPDRDADCRILDRRAGMWPKPRSAPLVGAAALIEAEATRAAHRGMRRMGGD